MGRRSHLQIYKTSPVRGDIWLPAIGEPKSPLTRSERPPDWHSTIGYSASAKRVLESAIKLLEEAVRGVHNES